MTRRMMYQSGQWIPIPQPIPPEGSPMRVSKPEPDPVLIEGTRIRETEKAILFCVKQVNGRVLPESKNEWFPISQMKSALTLAPDPEDPFNSEEESKAMDWMKMSHWICSTKGLV